MEGNITAQADKQIKILKSDKRKYNAKVITGGVLAGALLAGFIATKATDELQNPESLPFNGWVDFTRDYLSNAFRSLRGLDNTPFYEYIKPDNGLEGSLLGLFVGTKIWQYVQIAKKNKVKKEIRDIEMSR